jgi:hypothetical protein
MAIKYFSQQHLACLRATQQHATSTNEKKKKKKMQKKKKKTSRRERFNAITMQIEYILFCNNKPKKIKFARTSHSHRCFWVVLCSQQQAQKSK